MHVTEFTTELNDSRMLPIPQDVADQFLKPGRASIIALSNGPARNAEWRSVAYQQFLRGDAPEDFIYDYCR